MSACDRCGVSLDTGSRKRIWPKRCDACLRPEKHGQGPHIDHFAFAGWNYQLGRYIKSRKHQQQVCREIAEKTKGRVVPDWH